MGRPGDWQPLADADPVPGDPYDVAGLGRRFRATADLIASASQRLKTMCTDEFLDSDAGAAFRQRSDDTAGKLTKAYARYAAAATALGTDPGDVSPSTPARPNYAGSLVGQALAAVLGTVALAASVVALISDVLLEIGGKGSWTSPST